MRRLAGLAAVLVMALPLAAADTELTLVTGTERGTYHRFGHDLRRLLARHGITLTVYPSNGALDNVFAVAQSHGVQLGIVQSDLLAFLAEQRANTTLSRLRERLRLVFPLYDEQVHVIARRDITGLEALGGRRVAIGSEGSGTYLTAHWLFELAGVTPGEMLALDAATALAELRAGRLDAMVYVAGYPVGFLQRDVDHDDGLALIPIVSPRVLDAYPGAEIPAGVYAWHPAAIPTVVVKAVLVSSDAVGPSCERIGRFAREVAAGLDWLVQNGHPKWKRVDLDAPVAGWERSDCVRTHLGIRTDRDTPAASPDAENPVADAIKGALDRR